MATSVTSKGQVTIPKHVRDAMGIGPGSSVEFRVGKDGAVVLEKVGTRSASPRRRFEAARGSAQIRWREGELMKLLRGE